MDYIIIALLILIIHPYVTYPLSLMICNILIKNRDSFQTSVLTYYPSISILIAAYNEEKVIADKLVNSINLDYPQDKLEVIVASDGSTDRTNMIVKDFADDHNNIRLIAYPVREGKVNVINKSVPSCNGEIVVLSDANAIYNESALKHIARHFLNEHVGCVAGEKRINAISDGDAVGKNEGLYWKLEAFIKRQESNLKTVIGADGALYAIRKRLFKPLPQNTSVDDFLLSMFIVEQGYKIVYEPNAYSCEDAGLSLAAEFKRKVRIAAGNFYNLSYMRSLFGFNMISYMLISHKILRWVSPFIFGLLTILLIVRYSNLFYTFLFLLLLFSYTVAVFGYIFEQYLLRNKIIGLITHFYLTVFAQFIGFIKYIKGTQKAIWDTVR